MRLQLRCQGPIVPSSIVVSPRAGNDGQRQRAYEWVGIVPGADGGMTPVLRFDSSPLPLEEQFKAYDRLHPLFQAKVSEPTGAFDAQFETWFLGSMILTSYRADPIELSRTPEQIKADGVDNYAVQYTRSGGWTGVFDDRHSVGHPGQAVLLDFTRPMAFRSARSEVGVLLITRDVLDEVLPPFDLHGLQLADGAAGLVADHMEALMRRLPLMAAEDADGVCKATLDLLVRCLETLRPSQLPSHRPSPLLMQAKRYITRNLEADLSADAICAALGVSRASLYRTFEPLGGVAAFVQHRRLTRIHGLLARPDERRSVSELAYAFQFVNTEHFSRRFKSKFGYTATEQRRLSRERLASRIPGEPAAIDGTETQTLQALSEACDKTPVVRDRRSLIETEGQPLRKPAGL